MGISAKNSFNKVMGIDTLENQGVVYQNKVAKLLGTEEEKKTYNPFLRADGTLINKHIDYQKVLDNPNVTAKAKEFITNATGLTPSHTTSDGYTDYSKSSGVNFNANLDANSLASLDVTTELPKLSTEQISEIITQHFSNSTVIKPSDADGIYKAQQKTGMSALAILGIGALESGYGTSNIAKQKNNLWGWNATNSNPSGNATTFSPVAEGATQFAENYINTYYNGYGAKSIYSAGTGKNPSNKGYAYYDNGTINSSWADSVGSIMGKFYNTAKSKMNSVGTGTYGGNNARNSGSNYTPINSSGKLVVGSRIADTAKYNNSAAKGQCVWYVRGRASEKLGKTVGSLGNANEMWYNAKTSSKVAATADNIKPDMIVSYSKGTSQAGQKYGHVIYIEDVVGNTVYYTEGGSGYYKNGTDGVVKTATKQGILEGVNTNGSRMGSGVIGFIDLSKY